MIIGIWIVTVTFIVIVFGEIKYRFFDKKESKTENKKFTKTWEDSIDMDFDEFFMECEINELRKEEYGKMLWYSVKEKFV